MDDGALMEICHAAKPKDKSRILDAVHETAEDVQLLGIIDKRKQRKFEVLCLEPVPPDDGEQIGKGLRVSSCTNAPVMLLQRADGRQT